jgi:hypothetical protein
MSQSETEPVQFERHIARLLIVLYYSGRPVNSLLDGETHQVDSLWQLQEFDFWIREPGHLALALLHGYSMEPARFADKMLLHEALNRMIDQGDDHRVTLPGAPYNIYEDFDYNLSFLSARALVSDRPSFSRNQTHQIVLESKGVEFVKQIFDSCPSFAWYRAQCETVRAFLPILQGYDLNLMTYLSPDLTPATAATMPLSPFIRQRYQQTLGALQHVDV